jgi:hypothetical protein
MHRLVRAAVLVPLLLLAWATPAGAAPPGPRPTVTIGELTGPTEGPDGNPQWWLALDAVDPDGVIWEVQVKWSDGEVAWANTFCLQGPDVGTPAHLLIPHEFAQPGRYRVQVIASSHATCSFDNPPGSDQDSHPITKLLTVTG